MLATTTKRAMAVRVAAAVTVAGMAAGVANADPRAQFVFDAGGSPTTDLLPSLNWDNTSLGIHNSHPTNQDEALLDNSKVTLPGTMYLGGNNTFGFLTFDSPTLNTLLSSSAASPFTLTLSGGADNTVATTYPVLSMGPNAGDAMTINDTSGAITVGINTPVAVINVTNPTQVLTVGSLIRNSSVSTLQRSIEKTGAGTLVLSGTNTFGGTTSGVVQTVTISGGVLSATVDTNLGNAANQVVLNGGTFRVTPTANLSSARTFNVTAAGGGIDLANAFTLTLTGPLKGSGTLTKTGTAELILNNAAGTFNGTLAVNAGSVRMLNPGSVQGATVQLNATNSTLNLRNNNGGTYNVNVEATTKNAQVFVDRQSADPATGGLFTLGNINLGAVTLNLNGNAANNNSLAFGAVTLSGNGTIQASAIPVSIGAIGEAGGAHSLRKTGAATLTLTQPGTFTGGVNLAGGVLQVSADEQLGAAGANGLAPITVATDYSPTTPAPVTLKITGSYSTNRAVIAGDGTIDNAQAVTLGAVSGSGVLVKSGAGTLTVPSIVGGGLSVGDGAVVLAADGGTSKLSSFGYAIGKLDVKNNRVIFGGPTAASVRGWLSGGGIVSSIAQADTTGLTGIGYLTVGAGQLDITSWGGLDVTSGDVVTRVTHTGDINLDGKVNADDLALMDVGLAKNLSAGSALWVDGDVNYDGAVTSADFMLADRAFAKDGGALSPALLAEREGQFGSGYVSDLMASVPEPTVGGLFAVAGAILSLRRRRSGK